MKCCNKWKDRINDKIKSNEATLENKVIKKIKPSHNKTFKQDVQGCYKKWRQLDKKKTLPTWH
jgi:hypothetical protein